MAGPFNEDIADRFDQPTFLIIFLIFVVVNSFGLL
jgi:hypothetical protein